MIQRKDEKTSCEFSLTDGATAAARVAYALTESCFIFPITPSTLLSEAYDQWASEGVVNSLGVVPVVKQMQSEAGVAGALHGALVGGSVSTTFTSSQGLLLMIPNMYKIAGELLPCVLHVATRALSKHAITIFDDFSDIVAVAHTGFALLHATTVQECGDFAVVATISTLKSRVPFVHSFSGFRTSHELMKVNSLTDEQLSKVATYLRPDILKHRRRGMLPTNPTARGLIQGSDTFMQASESCNMYYDNVASVVEDAFDYIYEMTGRRYGLFDYTGHPGAERVLVIMGTGAEVVKLVVHAHPEQKIGVINVRLLRPFTESSFLDVLPMSVKCITILDHYKDQVNKEELYQKVTNSLFSDKRMIPCVSCRYGIGSKPFTPGMVVAILNNMNADLQKSKPWYSVPKMKKFISGIIPWKSPRGKSPRGVQGISPRKMVLNNKNEVKSDQQITSMRSPRINESNSLNNPSTPRKDNSPRMQSEQYNLSPRSLGDKSVFAVEQAPTKRTITVGIVDDVTHLSIEHEELDLCREDIKQYIFWGFGSDGTVGANKNATKIISQLKDPFYYAQAYFVYDALKAGGVTTSHLRFSTKKFEIPYEIISGADYIAVHKSEYITNPNLVGCTRLLGPLKEGGIVVINCSFTTTLELDRNCPMEMRRTLAEKKSQLFVIDANRIALSCDLQEQLINNIMQAVFLQLTGIIQPITLGLEMLRSIMITAYKKKGPDVVDANCMAVDKALQNLRKLEIPSSWSEWGSDVVSDQTVGNASRANLTLEEMNDMPEHLQVENTINIQRGLGSQLPVSAFTPDGVWLTSQTKLAKRGIAYRVPVVDMLKCTQCNKCAAICPHACIRPYLVSASDIRNAPLSFNTKPAIGGSEIAGLAMRIQVSPLDCTSCDVCVNACPEDALSMVEKGTTEFKDQIKNFSYVTEMSLDSKYSHRFDKYTLRGSQFQQPLLEFSGACAGCGETPYLKLLTQLFGKRMTIANASGCSTVFSGCHGFVPETVERKTKLGPAWGSSLFEDNAEYGYGLAAVIPKRREHLKSLVESCLSTFGLLKGGLRKYLTLWSDNWEDPERSEVYGLEARDLLKKAVHDSPSLSDSKLKISSTDVKKMMYALGKNEKTKINDIHLSVEETEGEHSSNPEIEKSQSLIDLLSAFELSFVKPSMWIIGGDGWANDIGYSGIDHIMRTSDINHNINLLVLDTEVYSNTGGQSSKSTPLSALVKFRQRGNIYSKKCIWEVALNSYPNAYVASIAIGADYTQSVKALYEAESYEGQSIVCCYCPCIEHRMNTGLSRMSKDQETAVMCGYWPIFRKHPNHGLILDHPNIDINALEGFLDCQNRFLQLKRDFPDVATDTRLKLAKSIIIRHNRLTKEAGLAKLVRESSIIPGSISTFYTEMSSAVFPSTSTNIPRGINNVDNLEFPISAETNGNVTGGNISTFLNIKIFFVSDGGNTSALANTLGKYLSRRKFVKVTVDPLSDFAYQNGDIMIFMVSTCGDGETPSNGKTIIEALEAGSLHVNSDMKFCIFGTGSNAYPKFCYAAKRLYAAINNKSNTNNTQEIIPVVYADESEQPIDYFYEEWKESLIEELGLNELIENPPPFINIHYPNLTSDDHGLYTPIIPKGCVQLRVSDNKRMTPDYYNRDIRHIILALDNEDIPFNLGDAIAIYPQNIPEEVDALFLSGGSLHHLSHVKDTILLMRATEYTPGHLRESCGLRITIRQLLVETLDIFGIPTKTFMSSLKDANLRVEGTGYLNISDTILYVKTTIHDETSFWKPTIMELLEYIPPMKSRLYSIASSDFHSPGKIELCIVINQFPRPHTLQLSESDNTISNELITGICCKYLASNPQTLYAHIHRGTFREADNPLVSKIMIGLGTGIAPLRAFCQMHSKAKMDGTQIGDIMLFYGTRRKKEEYLYEEDWEAMKTAGVITTLEVAFSHDMYPHDYRPKPEDPLNLITSNIRKYPNTLGSELGRGALVYYCGPKGPLNSMKTAIIESMIEPLGISHKEASELLEKRLSIEAY